MLDYTILYYTILYYTILYYTILYYTILYYTILYYTVLYCTVMYCTVLLDIQKSDWVEVWTYKNQVWLKSELTKVRIGRQHNLHK